MVICKKEHRYDSYFESLSDAQDNQQGGRHRCAGCAYEEGFADARSGKPQKPILPIYLTAKLEW